MYRLAEPQGKELVVLQLLLEDLVGLLSQQTPGSLRIIRNDDWAVTCISRSPNKGLV